jgi:hypothetical protein
MERNYDGLIAVYSCRKSTRMLYFTQTSLLQFALEVIPLFAMRLSTFLLPLAVASAARLQERQLGGKGSKGITGMLGGGSQAKFAGIDKQEPRIRKTATRHVVKFGPYTLRGAVSAISRLRSLLTLNRKRAQKAKGAAWA